MRYEKLTILFETTEDKEAATNALIALEEEGEIENGYTARWTTVDDELMTIDEILS